MFHAERILNNVVRFGILCALLSSCFMCGSGRNFSVEQLYARQGFSGADLGDRTITVSPLFTSDGGAIVNDELDAKTVIGAIHKKRPTLHLLPRELFEKHLIASAGEDALDSFYMSLAKGEMVTLQGAAQQWKSVGSDFLMVLKLTYGIRIKRGDETTRRWWLEGELWDCDSMEVVWRTAVDCRVAGKSSSDRQLLLASICRVFEALPPVVPGYGREKW